MTLSRFLLTLASWVSLAACQSTHPTVDIVTPLGTITAEVYEDSAPVTAANFLRNVDKKVYSEGRASFYRVVRPDNQPGNQVKIEVIQGGVDKDTGDLNTPYIRHETTDETGIRHLDGTVSMAREEPGTANTEFFICVGDQPELDFGGRRNPDGQGFAAFGQVVRGIEVVKAIQKVRDRDGGQYLNPEIPILDVRRAP